VRVIIRGPREEVVRGEARRIADIFRETAKSAEAELRILGPAPAPLLKLKSFFRYHLQISASAIEPLLTWWRVTEPHLSLPDEVELTVDVDPLDLR
jgi:primosomal protein N' (replication factor Y)